MKFLGVPWGLRPRRTEQKLALSLLSMLPSAHVNRVGVRIVSFRGSMATPPILYLRFAGSLAVAAQDSRPSGSLLLSCKALSSSTSCRLSGKAMARTGLRMMPTFPLPPLKFRTAGFPRYGFKAGLLEGAFPAEAPNCRAHLVCVPPSRSSLSNLFIPARCRGSCALERRHSSDCRRSTPGVLAPVRVILSRSIYA